jgi:hypothetical protein
LIGIENIERNGRNQEMADLDKILEAMQAQLQMTQQLNSTVTSLVQGVEALSDRTQLLEMKAEADERERLEIDREKLKMKEQFNEAGKVQERQMFESEARKLIADDEQRALNQILNEGDITDPRLIGRFGMVSGGNIVR